MDVLLTSPSALMVKLARASLGMSAAEAGQVVGVDSWWWDSWESGSMQMPPQYWTLFCVFNSYHPLYVTVSRADRPQAPLDDIGQLGPYQSGLAHQDSAEAADTSF